MKRLLLCLAVLLAAAACSGLDSKAATVNGSDIDDSSVEDELLAIAANRAYRESIEQQPQIRVLGITRPNQADSFDTAFVAQVVTRQILFEIIEQALERRKVEPTAEVRRAARADLIQQIGGQNVFRGFPESYRRQLTKWNTDALALQADLVGLPALSGRALETYFRRNPDQFQLTCARHILVEDEADANEIRKQLTAGAPFEALAREHSLDTGSAEQGGSLGCNLRGFLQPEFEQAAFSQTVGEIGPPVQTVFGWHVIRVDDRRVPELEDIRDDLRTRVQNLALDRFEEWVRDAIFAAKVDVNPRFGTWNEISGRVDAPGAPAAASTTTSTVPVGSAPPAPPAP